MAPGDTLWERLSRVFDRGAARERSAAERILLEADFGVAATDEILDQLAGVGDEDVRATLERAVRVPIRFLGTGESLEDLEVFDANRFARRLISV